MENEVESYPCPFCSEKFETFSKVNLHMDTHNGNALFTSAKSPDVTAVDKHLITHSPQNHEHKHQGGKSESTHSFLCSCCRKSFGTLKEVSVHMKTHDGERLYKCSQCGFVSGQMSVVQSHITTHTKQAAAESNKANGSFTRSKPTDLVLGEPNGVVDEESLTPCLLTESQTLATGINTAVIETTPRRITDNIYISGNGKNKQLAQESKKVNLPAVDLQSLDVPCGGIGTRRVLTTDMPWSDTQGHIIKPKRVYKCSQCSKKFIKKSYLKRHMVHHTREKPHKCSHCGSGFSQAGNLRQHIMRTHTGEKPHRCSDCGKQFRRDINLKRHVVTHTGEKFSTCCECGEEATMAAHLKTHTMTHTREKPHVCSDCGKRFIHANNLTIHLASHTNHKCSVCRKRFYQSSDLSRHMLTHRGIKNNCLGNEKLHKCVICCKQFTQLAGLSRHMVTHTGEKPHGVGLHSSFKSEEGIEMCENRENCTTNNTVMNGLPGSGCVETCVNIPSDNESCPQVQNTANSILTSTRESASASTLVHDSTIQIYQALIQMVDKPCQFKSDQAPGIGTPIVIKPESAYSPNQSNPGTMFQEPKEEEVNPYVTQILQTGENTPKYSGYETFSEALDQMPDKINHKFSQLGYDQIEHTKHVHIPTTSKDPHEHSDLQLCWGRNTVCKDGKAPCGSSIDCEESFEVKGQMNIQAVKTDQVSDMVEEYNSYMEGIDYTSCKMCVKGFTKAVYLEEHLEKHLAEHILVHTEDVDRTFTIRQNTQSYTQNYKCSVIAEPVSYPSQDTMHTGEEHSAYHETCLVPEEPHQYSVCSGTLISPTKLSAHKITPLGDKPHQCSVCDESFSESHDLAVHMMTHTGQKSRQCSVCRKRLSSSSSLYRHMMIHTGDRPHVCSDCGRKFSTTDDLKTHTRSHTGEKPYKCSDCGKRFTKSSNLTKHTRTHTGEKPYKCSDCSKQFTQACNLKTHMMTHTGEKPHKCPYCGKQFTHAFTLYTHVKIHTVEKSYKCSHCDENFSWYDHLKRHMMTHIRLKPTGPSNPIGTILF